MQPEFSIIASDLTKVYSRGIRKSPINALTRLSLNVAGGEIFGLLGPNGAGKTTLVKILLGLVKPTGGTGSLLGVDINDFNARQSVGYLPENHRFPGFLTAVQMLHLFGRLAGVSEEDRERRIPQLLELVNMSKWGDTRIKQYSKGMMQRVGIAQALINDPKVVFLDEPTDGVDPIGRKEIRDVLLELKRQGKTVFLNSHLLSELERVCTKLAIMSEGELVRQGSLESLLGDSTSYTIVATNIPMSLVSVLPLHASSANYAPNGATDLTEYAVNVESRADLNEIIDTLRTASVQIESIAISRDSLEDYFIKVLDPKSVAGVSE